MRDYIKQAINTDGNDEFYRLLQGKLSKKSLRLLHGVMGLSTEAGEALDILKRHIFYGKDISNPHLIEELGDVMWYIALICDELGIDFKEIQETNIKKLKTRYPKSFNQKDAINRDLEAENKVLGK